MNIIVIINMKIIQRARTQLRKTTQ